MWINRLLRCRERLWENFAFHFSNRLLCSWIAFSRTRAGWIWAFITACNSLAAAMASRNPLGVVKSASVNANWCFGESSNWCYIDKLKLYK